MSTQEERLTEIANAIRYAEGSTGLIPALSFAARIRALSSGGSGGGYDLQAKTATPAKSQLVILPDAAYYGLSSVTVAAIPAQYQDVSGVDAAAADVLLGKKLVDASGNVLTGTMPNNGAVEVSVESGSSYSIPEGYHNGSGKVKATGGAADPVIQGLSISENGTYTAPSGVDGYSPITVDVPTVSPVIQELSVEENGTYDPPNGVDGFGPVNVNVPSEEPVLESLSVSENGTYTPPDGVSGFDSVEVNVPSSGEAGERYVDVAASSENEAMGSVTGGGRFGIGDTVSLEASLIGDAKLQGWYENDELISTDNPFQFTIPNPDRIFVARFRQGLLPTGYTELSALYHKASGQLSLGIPFTENTRIDVTITVLSSSTISIASQIWGFYSATAEDRRFFGLYAPYYKTLRIVKGQTSTTVTVNNLQNTKSVLSLDYPRGTLSVDGIVYSSVIRNYMSAFSPVYLTPVANVSYYILANFHRIQVYDSDILTNDFVPCQNASGDIGFYDIVQENFIQASTAAWSAVA